MKQLPERATRQGGPLRRSAQEIAGAEVLALDATEEGAPSRVFDVLKPDILVLCGGAFPPAAPLHEQGWAEFAVNWETDVKIAFHFLKAALSRPLPAGALVVLISSGAVRRSFHGLPFLTAGAEAPLLFSNSLCRPVPADPT